MRIHNRMRPSAHHNGHHTNGFSASSGVTSGWDAFQQSVIDSTNSLLQAKVEANQTAAQIAAQVQAQQNAAAIQAKAQQDQRNTNIMLAIAAAGLLWFFLRKK